MTAHASTLDSLGALRALDSCVPHRRRDVDGRCSGKLLYSWAENIQRRFGDEAVRQARAAMGHFAQGLPDAPRSADWLPIEAHLRLTRFSLEALHGGDEAALCVRHSGL